MFYFFTKSTVEKSIARKNCICFLQEASKNALVCKDPEKITGQISLIGRANAQLEVGELQADEGFLEKDRLQFKGNVILQSGEIEIQSQEIIYLTTTNKLQSHLPFSFFKKQEKINITGNSFLYDITKKSLQLKK